MKKTFFLFVFCIVLIACGAATVSRPAAYLIELEACNADASTLQESIECENRVRLKYPLPDGAPRPLRELPDANKDGSDGTI